MTASVERLINEFEGLSVDELLALLEGISKELRRKTGEKPEKVVLSQQVIIPGAYQFSAEEIEAELAAAFTPQELAEIEIEDISNLTLPVGAKTTTEILSEDREDRF
jgi:predicted pyridoxine 5'-phosphate oxidase superfamily flavin-nucleotide-binding protein